MAFNFLAFAGGGAKKIVEDAEEEKKSLLKFIDDNVSTWKTAGLKNHQDRKTIKRNLRIQGKQLEALGLKGDRLQLVLGTGNAQKVIDHANSYKQEYGKPLPIDEIVSLSEGHKDTGRSLDEYIDGIIGNVKQGKDLSQSIIDVQTSGEASIGEKLGLFDKSKLIKSRLETFKSISGLDMGELRALAENDLEFDELPEGTVSLPDPKKKFASIGEIKSIDRQLYQHGLGATGAELLTYTSEGQPLYKTDKVDIRNEANRFAAELNIIFSERTGKGEDPAIVLNELKTMMAQHMSNYKPSPVPPPLVTGTTKQDYLDSFTNVYKGLKNKQDKRILKSQARVALAKIIAGKSNVSSVHIQEANRLIEAAIASI